MTEGYRCRAAAVVLGLGLMGGLAPGIVHAASPVNVYEFHDAELEQRYRGLIAELRCPKCLNTNLAGSDAPIAEDLRRTVHRLVNEKAMSDAEVRAYLQARYGDFVLYDPPFRPDTWVLWLAPLGLVLVGIGVLWRVLRQPPDKPLSTDEAARLRAILERE